MNIQTLSLIVSVALFVLAGAAMLRARGAKAEVSRLRAEGEAALRQLEQARTSSEVARAQLEAQVRLVDDRDHRLRDIAREVEALRQTHRDAETRCADAESRCAKANEAVSRLEAVERGLREDVAAVRRLLQDTQDEHTRLKADHAALRADTDGKLISAAREVESLKAIREEMTREFRDLAGRTLRETGSEFSRAHEEKLNALLSPFKEQVGRFELELREVHQSAGRDRAVLTEQIRELTSRTEMVSQEATNLARALKGEKHRQGAWGEAQLERYLEYMGYQKDIDFVTQSSRTGDEGDRLRPDVILRMPGGKALVIDSKVSMVSYAAAIGAETEEERGRHLRDHVKAVKARIDELASKGYQNLEDGAVDWVLLFMPIEGAVSAAWAHEADIGTYAMERGIGIAYPTTLLMALRTVKHLWDVENRNKNAESIAERAGFLYDKLAGFIESFSAVGRALGTATAAHEKALGQLTKGSGNLVGQVEKLKKLGAKTNKSLALAFDGDSEEDAAAAREPANEAPQRVIPAAE
ncbi:DNA recombination protein RmuC [Rubellimicrobium arenae]|uniref:DNA recombination protein RmuC n=1 Tax=Rubellimicrobium arenae TaxID=2817372 RepID=UPI001FEF3696|nr:DNA recombination protein RmuC [Rubellimicrobium arenae]